MDDRKTSDIKTISAFRTAIQGRDVTITYAASDERGRMQSIYGTMLEWNDQDGHVLLMRGHYPVLINLKQVCYIEPSGQGWDFE